LVAVRRAGAARFILDGGFNMIWPGTAAAFARGCDSADRRNERFAGRRALGIISDRTLGCSSWGTVAGLPKVSRTLRSTETDPAWRCALAESGIISTAARIKTAVTAIRAAALSSTGLAKLRAIISNPNYVRAPEPG
jgi:hypothetical protein